MFWAFLGPPTYFSINSTVNQQKLTFSDPTHPTLYWRNTWMVLEAKWPLPESIFTSLWNFYMVLFRIRNKNRLKIRQFWRFQKQTYTYIVSYFLIFWNPWEPCGQLVVSTQLAELKSFISTMCGLDTVAKCKLPQKWTIFRLFLRYCPEFWFSRFCLK